METHFLFYYLTIPVFTGILSTIFYVIFIDKLFFQIFVPWYFSKKYKSTIIEGKWEGRTKSNLNPNKDGFDKKLYHNFSLNIIQKGDRIFGSMYVETVEEKIVNNKQVSEEKTHDNVYDFNGTIRDGYVSINSKEQDPKKFGMNSFIFQIAGSGRTLNGKCVFIAENKHVHFISTTPWITLERKL